LATGPIGYGDLEPCYGAAEAEIGVSADVTAQAYHGISFPPGYAYPMLPIPPSLVDAAVAGARGRHDIAAPPSP